MRALRAITPTLRSNTHGRFFSTQAKNPWDICDDVPESAAKKYDKEEKIATNPLAVKLFKPEPASVAKTKEDSATPQPPKTPSMTGC